MTSLLRGIASLLIVLLFAAFAVAAARNVQPKTAGVAIAAMSGFSALSTAFGFQILSLRREVRRTKGLDEERRLLLRRRLDRSTQTLFLRWGLSFLCGLFGTAVGLIVREYATTQDVWPIAALGFSLCGGSIFFLFLMIVEYRSLFTFATDLEEHAEEIEKKQQWADRTRKIVGE